MADRMTEPVLSWLDTMMLLYMMTPSVSGPVDSTWTLMM